jgi:hypothetical protein
METADPSNPCIKKAPYTAPPLSASRSFNHFRFDSSSTECFELADPYQKYYLKRPAAVRQFGRLGMILGHQGA